MSHLQRFRVGDYVDVAPVTRRGRPNSEGGRGYILRSPSPSSVIDVEYIIPKKKLSLEVAVERLSLATMDTTARRNANSDSVVTPSLLSPHLQASKRILSTVTPSNTQQKKAKSSNLITSTVLLDRGRQFKDNNNNTSHHPILVYLQRNNNKDKGYLRCNDAKAAGITGTLKKQLSSDERNLELRMKAQLTGVNKQFGATQLIADAYGVSKRQLNRWEKEQDQSRKPRSDAGSNLLTSTKLQENYHGAYQVFKKAYRRQKISDMDTLLGEDINDDRLFDLWNGIMSDEDRKPYIEMSKRFKERAPFLPGEITTILKNTNGSVTWKQIKTALSDAEDGVPIVSEGTIRTIFMGLPG